MLRRVLKSKIQGAVVTDSSVNYEGSISLDRDLMEAADLEEFEEVHVWDMTNGQRLSTYVIEGGRGSGRVCMNGAAALLVKKGDRVIITSFVECDEDELKCVRPKRIFVDGENKVIERKIGKDGSFN